MADRVRTVARWPSRPWPWRTTNLAVLGVLALAFVTGVAAQATGSARGAWIAVAHGAVGLVVVALLPAQEPGRRPAGCAAGARADGRPSGSRC